jgi:hypothetical protein
MTDPSVYISVDVETDGPIPGPHSMLALGAAAFEANGTHIGSWSANLETLPDAAGAPDTMAWWSTQPEAWAACRKDLRTPGEAMPDFVAWVERFKGKPVFVAFPAGFDFLFAYWYMVRFAGRSPFSFSALDIKTYAAALLGIPYREATKRRFPRAWFGPAKHSHIAAEDALEQGQMFMRMLAARREVEKLTAPDA